MPRTNSVRRKYFPARLKAPSFSSFHRVGRGRRKSFGGGPSGVADRGALLEKSIAVGHLLKLVLLCRYADIGLLRASATNGRVAAIFAGVVAARRFVASFDVRNLQKYLGLDWMSDADQPFFTPTRSIVSTHTAVDPQLVKDIVDISDQNHRSFLWEI